MQGPVLPTLTLTSRLLTMEVWIESFVTHFIDFLHVVCKYMVQELFQICSRVDILQLFLVQIQHFVHPSFEFKLKQNNVKHTFPEGSLS